MLRSQKEKESFALFILSCTPLTIELVHSIGMLTVVDWHIVCFTYLFWQLCTYRRKYRLLKIGPNLFDEICRIMLIFIVTYAWLSFLTSIRSVAVFCILEDASNMNNRHQSTIFHACKAGLSQSCLASINDVNKHSANSRQCPSALVGNRLGYTYFFLVVAFRFIPCGVYGLWIMYCWKMDVDGSEKTTTSTPVEIATTDSTTLLSMEKTHSEKNQSKIVNQKWLLVCIGLLGSCITVETALQGQIHSLSSPFVILPYVALISIQYSLFSKRYRESSKEVLYILQTLAMHMSIVVSLFDFFLQVLYVTSVCIPEVVSISELTDVCSKASHYHAGREEDCHELIQKHLVKPITSDMCPSYFSTNNNSNIVGILYTANILKVLVLSLCTLLLKEKLV